DLPTLKRRGRMSVRRHHRSTLRYFHKEESVLAGCQVRTGDIGHTHRISFAKQVVLTVTSRAVANKAVSFIEVFAALEIDVVSGQWILKLFLSDFHGCGIK